MRALPVAEGSDSSGPPPLARISEFWNWLPAFRAVAETGHLPSAARLLGLSAPALSRSVRLLEQNLGVELFWRDGKGMRLTESGERFARALRDGMRRIHDGFASARDELMSGVVRVSSEGAVTTVAVTPALLSMRLEHPRLELAVRSTPYASCASALLAGELDVAFHSGRTVQGPGVECRSIGALARSVYCAKDHPLARRADDDAPATLRELADEHEFVAPPPATVEGCGECPDGWPIELPRRVALEVDRLRVGFEACSAGGLLAILPDALVELGRGPRSASASPGLRRIPTDPPIPAERVFAATRTELGAPSRAQHVRDAVERALAAHA